MHRPDVPEPLCPQTPVRVGRRGLLPGPPGLHLRLLGPHGPDHQGLRGRIERFVKHEGVDLVTFEKGQRKDDVAHEYLADFEGDEGVLFVGKAQEKTTTFRTEKRTNP